MNKFILTSISSEKNHNIDILFSDLKHYLEKYNCKFVKTGGYIFDNGIGISEKLQHNSITKNVKKIVTSNIFKSKSYIRSLW